MQHTISIRKDTRATISSKAALAGNSFAELSDSVGDDINDDDSYIEPNEIEDYLNLKEMSMKDLVIDAADGWNIAGKPANAAHSGVQINHGMAQGSAKSPHAYTHASTTTNDSERVLAIIEQLVVSPSAKTMATEDMFVSPAPITQRELQLGIETGSMTAQIFSGTPTWAEMARGVTGAACGVTAVELQQSSLTTAAKKAEGEKTTCQHMINVVQDAAERVQWTKRVAEQAQEKAKVR